MDAENSFVNCEHNTHAAGRSTIVQSSSLSAKRCNQNQHTAIVGFIVTFLCQDSGGSCRIPSIPDGSQNPNDRPQTSTSCQNTDGWGRRLYSNYDIRTYPLYERHALRLFLHASYGIIWQSSLLKLVLPPSCKRVKWDDWSISKNNSGIRSREWKCLVPLWITIVLC
jgi:hypothetical protein